MAVKIKLKNAFFCFEFLVKSNFYKLILLLLFVAKLNCYGIGFFEESEKTPQLKDLTSSPECLLFFATPNEHDLISKELDYLSQESRNKTISLLNTLLPQELLLTHTQPNSLQIQSRPLSSAEDLIEELTPYLEQPYIHSLKIREIVESFFTENTHFIESINKILNTYPTSETHDFLQKIQNKLKDLNLKKLFFQKGISETLKIELLTELYIFQNYQFQSLNNDIQTKNEIYTKAYIKTTELIKKLELQIQILETYINESNDFHSSNITHQILNSKLQVISYQLIIIERFKESLENQIKIIFTDFTQITELKTQVDISLLAHSKYTDTVIQKVQDKLHAAKSKAIALTQAQLIEKLLDQAEKKAQEELKLKKQTELQFLENSKREMLEKGALFKNFIDSISEKVNLRLKDVIHMINTNPNGYSPQLLIDYLSKNKISREDFYYIIFHTQMKLNYQISVDDTEYPMKYFNKYYAGMPSFYKFELLDVEPLIKDKIPFYIPFLLHFTNSREFQFQESIEKDFLIFHLGWGLKKYFFNFKFYMQIKKQYKNNSPSNDSSKISDSLSQSLESDYFAPSEFSHLFYLEALPERLINLVNDVIFKPELPSYKSNYSAKLNQTLELILNDGVIEEKPSLSQESLRLISQIQSTDTEQSNWKDIILNFSIANPEASFSFYELLIILKESIPHFESQIPPNLKIRKVYPASKFQADFSDHYISELVWLLSRLKTPIHEPSQGIFVQFLAHVFYNYNFDTYIRGKSEEPEERNIDLKKFFKSILENPPVALELKKQQNLVDLSTNKVLNTKNINLENSLNEYEALKGQQQGILNDIVNLKSVLNPRPRTPKQHAANKSINLQIIDLENTYKVISKQIEKFEIENHDTH